MSHEFIKVATREINEDLSRIAEILDSCKNDDDVSKNSHQIEKHVHNIKGLAPMMGKEKIGSLAKPLDSILKTIISGKKVDGMLEPLCMSVQHMQIEMDNPHDMGDIQKQISDIALKIVD